MNNFNHLDAIRILVTKLEEEKEDQSRRFSVDPKLTNLNILRNLIGRAFDLKGNFEITYRARDDYGEETILPLVSDWDLNAAFLSSSNSDLQLLVKPKSIPDNLDLSNQDEPWEIIRSYEAEGSQSNSCNSSFNSQEINKKETVGIKNSIQNSNIIPSPQFNVKFNHAGLFNTMERWVQKAKTFVEDISVITTRPPLSDVEFRNYLDPAGVLCRPRELRFACYHGGVEPSLRKVVWKHLLNVYPEGLSGTKRIEYIRKKSKDYHELRESWKNLIKNQQVSENAIYVSKMVMKDVLRTDRHLKFFAGNDENQNIESLYHILTTYALNHPSVGYCQGMSDLASPLLVTLGDEAQAYICFCSIMERIKPNFSTDGLAMSLKFSHLAEAIAHYDPYFWNYLKSIGADDLLFCYRWLLLELKREFAFDDSLRMMEVLWATHPYNPHDILLYEEKFSDVNVGLVSIIPNLEPFSKVCSMRRISTLYNAKDIRLRRITRKKKENSNLSLDENSLSSLSSNSTSSLKSTQKTFYSLDDTIDSISSFEFLNNSMDLSPHDNKPEENNPTKPKLVKDLKEFFLIGRSNSDHEKLSSPIEENSPGSNEKTVINPDLKPASDLRENFENHLENLKFSKEDSTQFHNDDLTPKNKDSFAENHNEIDGNNSNGFLNQNVLNVEKLGIEGEFDNDSGHGCSESIEIVKNFPGARIPRPEEFGGGNPFLMFLALTLLLNHRDHIVRNNFDYNETAMYFDKLIRKHNVTKVLAQARQMYSNYLKNQKLLAQE